MLENKLEKFDFLDGFRGTLAFWVFLIQSSLIFLILF